MRVTGPDGAVEALLVADGDESPPTLEVRLDGRTILEPSPLGVSTLTDEYGSGLELVDGSEEAFDREYRTVGGKRRRHRHRGVQATATFENAAGRRIEVDVRVADGLVAYRYRLPGSGPVVVTGEESAFELPPEAAAWLMPFEKKHEGVWRETAVAEAAGQYGYPTLFETDAGWLLLAEAAVDGGYAASRLAVDAEGTTFRVRYPDDPRHRMVPGEQEVSGRRPLETPWRVAVVGSLADVVESDFVADLMEPADGADPSRLDDSSWVNPGRVAWSWWSDGESPGDFETQRRYVDYASERGWEYVLVDAGWEAEWIPELVEYADERDVGVFIWARWSDVDTAAEREVRFGRWKSWGVAGVKVDYMNSDAQQMMRFYDELAESTAEHELMLNVHGSITPKGLRRRWPHLLTYEGVRGAENYHPAPKTIPPSHNVVLPFTRNVLGPMDYTPVTFSAETRQTTVGHELALSVVFETPLQHFADAVESYAERPLAERFLERVPTVWDDTRFLGGRPGEVAAVARRAGEEWYVGSITAGGPRAVDVEFDFLEDGASYDCVLVRDAHPGEATDGVERLAAEERLVGNEDAVSVEVPRHGGFAARLVPSR